MSDFDFISDPTLGGLTEIDKDYHSADIELCFSVLRRVIKVVKGIRIPPSQYL